MKRLRANRANIVILSLIVILTGSSVFAMFSGREADHGENPIGELDVMRSQSLVTGTGYKLNYDQQKKRDEEEKKKEEKKQEEQKKDRTNSTRRTGAWSNAAPGAGNDRNSRNGSTTKNNGTKGGNNPGKSNNGSGGNNNNNSNVTPDPGIDESKLPTIYTDLEDGMSYGGSYLGFYVTAKDYTNRSISRQFFVVYANDERIFSSGTDDNKGNYDFSLRDGTNTVSITVTDREGNSATRMYSINGDTSAEGEEIGVIEISLSARNLNLGYLAGPRTMTVYKNEKLSYVITRFLTESGFGYDYSGSLSSGFYLKRIMKPGMLSGWSIPDSIQEHLDDINASIMGWDEDSLGEKDIYEGSGWMYSYNGEIVEFGFSSIVVMDGDEVEIWFTTHLGDDR